MRTNASGSAIERSTCVSAAKFTIASGAPGPPSEPVERARDRLRVLDAAPHEAVAGLVRDVLQVLLAPRVGELVEHGHRVPVLADAHPREVRADEPGAAADQEPHARIIPILALG